VNSTQLACNKAKELLSLTYEIISFPRSDNAT
jgi:hypothetical protein